MTQFVVDGGGTWWSDSVGLLRSGVHETDNLELIREIKSSNLDWVHILDEDVVATLPPTPELASSVEDAAGDPPPRETPVSTKEIDVPAEVAPGVTQLVDANPGGHVPNTEGPLTTADLHPTPEQFMCGLCPTFKSKSKQGLMSHRRNKHPELDPMTGSLKQPTVSVQERVTQPSQRVEGSGPIVGA